MAATQTSDEIQEILTRLEGQWISNLQVLGINSLKSVSPKPDAFVGEKIEAARVADRRFTLTTTCHEMVIDLQRAGKLVWISQAKPYLMAPGSSRPTVRLIFASEAGLDLTEPTNTKRITVSLSARA